ncbi:hypothetical protein KAR91_20650 [Candidatus Pacearchaeota archaeon]|nr:hypothetical protein [Candidatus Pacearchaeota archaeon]
MTELEQGVWDKYNNDAALKAQLTGGFHNTEAKQGSDRPYGVFQIISNTQRLTFSEDQESFLLQIKLFSNKSSSSELNRMFDAIKNTYDFTTLTMTDYTSVSCSRVNAIKSKLKDVWQYTITYIILIEKNVSAR